MSDNAESKLARNLVQWLSEQHWDVYQEVKFGYGGGIADIAATRAGLLWIIECKTSLTFKVLQQASGWTAYFRSVNEVRYSLRRSDEKTKLPQL